MLPALSSITFDTNKNSNPATPILHHSHPSPTHSHFCPFALYLPFYTKTVYWLWAAVELMKMQQIPKVEREGQVLDEHKVAETQPEEERKTGV